MSSVSGTIRIGEAAPTARSTLKRQRGSKWPLILTMLAMWLGGGAIGFAVGHYAGWEEILCAGAGALVGVFAYPRFCRMISVWQFRKTLTGKGVPLDLQTRMQITADEIVYETGDVVAHARWRAVSELYYAKGYWIFLVQSSPWTVPDHFFSEANQKRAFIAEALSYMSEAARARSPQAVKFAEGRES
jgi:hypothetical protein